jgi:hypothetical protein
MSLLSVVITFLSFAPGRATRGLKILAEADLERHEVVQAISLTTMTISPYLIPGP